MRKVLAVCLVLMLAMVSLVGCGSEPAASDQQAADQPQESLMVYSGAGLRKPMDEIGQVYEEQFGVKIEYTYAGSAQNLSQIELVQEGDVYIPGAMSYIKSAEEKGLVASKKDVVYHIPAIAVPKGNPANITCLADFAKPDVKVVLGDERSAAIGKVAQKMLQKNKLVEAVEKNVVSKDATVNEVMVHVAMAQADACIIWEDNVQGVDEVEIIEIPAEQNMIKTIPAGVLTCSQKLELAQQFVDFVASAEGKAIFEKHGFKVVE